VLLSGGAVPASDRNCERGRKIYQEMVFLHLINSLGNRSNFKLTEVLSGDELLIIKSPETCVVVSSVEYSKSFAHKHLVGSEATHQIGGRELDCVMVVIGQNCKNIVFNIRN
jgi:hypothetical protein